MLQTPQELLIYTLQEIEDAEMQAARALQQQLDVDNEELQQLLQRRLQQGEEVLTAVTSGLEQLGGAGKREPNTAARGLLDHTAHVLELAQTPGLKQVVLIAGVQKLEHYCLAAWGTLRALASELGQQELAESMQRALDQGHALDQDLSDLAEGWINPDAIEQADLEEDEAEGRDSAEDRRH